MRAVAYLASYLSRAMFMSATIVAQTLKRLCPNLNNPNPICVITMTKNQDSRKERDEEFV